MEKLSQSRASKRYLEKRVKSKPLPDEIQKCLEQARKSRMKK